MLALIIVFSSIAWYITGLIGTIYYFRDNIRGIPRTSYQRQCQSEDQVKNAGKLAAVCWAFIGIFFVIFAVCCVWIPKTLTPAAKRVGNGMEKVAEFLS